MIRARLRLPAAAAAARRLGRTRRQNASTSAADRNAAEVRPTGKPALMSSVRADRARAGREIQPPGAMPAADGARRARNPSVPGRARSRGVAGRRTRGRTGPRSPGAGTEADVSSPRPRLCSTCTGTGRACARGAAATGAANARAIPVLTSRGSGAGAETAAGCSTGTTAGAGATPGGGSSPVADGPAGGTSATGSSESGSRYPFGSEARRTPR